MADGGWKSSCIPFLESLLCTDHDERQGPRLARQVHTPTLRLTSRDDIIRSHGAAMRLPPSTVAYSGAVRKRSSMSVALGGGAMPHRRLALSANELAMPIHWQLEQNKVQSMGQQRNCFRKHINKPFKPSQKSNHKLVTFYMFSSYEASNGAKRAPGTTLVHPKRAIGEHSKRR